MEEKDIKTTEVPGEEEEMDDDGAAEELAAKIAALKGKESDSETEEEKDSEKDPTTEEKADQDPDSDPAKEQEKESAKSSLTDEEIEERVNARVQERIEAAVREASQKAADAVLAKERAREDSARRKLREYELRAGKSLDQLIAEYTGQQVQTLMERDGLDEATARRIVEAEAKARELEARERERQFEHAVFTAKNAFVRDLGAFIADPNADPSVKKLTVKYREDIEAFAYGAIENGNAMSMEVARDYILGKHLPELLKEQQAELERIKTATEQRTLKNVQERAKAKPESGSSAVPSVPTVSREERAFLKKLGMDDNDIADIAKKRAARQKK